LYIKRIPAPGFSSNCWLFWDGPGGEAAVVDPSASAEDICAALEENGLVLKWIFLTHGHFDHLFALDALRQHTNAPAAIHQSDAEMLSDPVKNASALFFGEADRYRSPERLLSDGDTISVGELSVKVVHTPGHSPGSVCYRVEDVLFTGDTLFDGGIGRTDLPGGSTARLEASLAHLAHLPGSVRIYPGHGGISNVEEQKRTNPYLRHLL